MPSIHKFAHMLGWSIASVCTVLTALVLIILAIRQRRMRLWWSALFMIMLSFCFAAMALVSIGKRAYTTFRGWLSPRDGIATYTALFGADAESCVLVAHHRDQLIPKIDTAIKLRVRICPSEMERILSQLEYRTTISSPAHAYQYRHGSEPGFDLASLGDSVITHYREMRPGRNWRWIHTNLDTTDAVIIDVLD